MNDFLLKPIIGGKETFASASYDSIYGTISLSWEKVDNKVVIKISIPSNTKAHFIYQDKDEVLNYGTYEFEF